MKFLNKFRQRKKVKLDKELEERRKIRLDNPFFCPRCNSQMLFVGGAIKCDFLVCEHCKHTENVSCQLEKVK